MDRSSCRSNKYQHVILESACSDELLIRYSDNQAYSSLTNLHTIEQIKDLHEKLNAAYWRLINTQLTKRQKEVLTLAASSEKLTQTDIAKKLKVNQSSITKAIHGNCDYKNSKNKKGKEKGKKIYGGARKKLQKLALEDAEIQNLLKEINELQSSLDY